MQIKKIIPNILTSMRLVVIPFVFYLGLTNKYEYLAIVGVFVALTDCFDGMLARRWNVCSEWGARLDSGSDKLLTISLLIILVIKNNIFIYMLIFEAIIAILNLITFYKTRINKSLMIGKVKTWAVYTTLVLGVINIFYSIKTILLIFYFISLFLEILSIIGYFYNTIEVYSKKKRPTKEELIKEHHEIIKDIIKHPEYQKRKKFAHHYNESVYEHCYRVSFDAFCFAKKHKLNYKDAAIAGILHDFYYKPWQDNIDRNVPLFKKHGFVHAHEALENSRKYFGDYLNPVIENAIERHMFPLNKVPPKHKIGWLIVVIDKKDSMSFMAHPSVFKKCFIKGSKKK